MPLVAAHGNDVCNVCTQRIMTVSSVCGFWCQLLLVFRVESDKTNNTKLTSWVVFVVIRFPLRAFVYRNRFLIFFPSYFLANIIR